MPPESEVQTQDLFTSTPDLLYGTPPAEEPEQEKPVAETKEAKPEKTDDVNDQLVVEEEESEPEETAKAAADEEQSEEIRTVQEMIDHFDLDPEWFNQLQHTIKVNGQEQTVPLSELISRARQVTAAEEYLADAKAKGRTMIQEANQNLQKAQEQVVVTAKLLEELEALEEERFSKEDLATLRKDDPGEYSARVEERRQWHEKRKGLKDRLAKEYQESVSRAQEQLSKALEENLPTESEILEAQVPDFSDEERKAIPEYMMQAGFSEQDIRLLGYNGRALALAVKAMRWDDSKKKVKTAQKRVRKVPKVMKSGSKKSGDTKQPVDRNDRASILYG